MAINHVQQRQSQRMQTFPHWMSCPILPPKTALWRSIG